MRDLEWEELTDCVLERRNAWVCEEGVCTDGLEEDEGTDEDDDDEVCPIVFDDRSPLFVCLCVPETAPDDVNESDELTLGDCVGAELCTLFPLVLPILLLLLLLTPLPAPLRVFPRACPSFSPGNVIVKREYDGRPCAGGYTRLAEPETAGCLRVFVKGSAVVEVEPVITWRCLLLSSSLLDG